MCAAKGLGATLLTALKQICLPSFRFSSFALILGSHTIHTNMTEEKTVKHRKRLPLRERAEILRLTDEKRPEVIVRSQESYCILLVKSFFVYF